MRYLKKFPTLLAGAAVLLSAVVLLSCRSRILNAESRPVEPAGRQSANANVTNVVTGNTAEKADRTAPTANATVQDGVQYVTSTVSNGWYEPITIQQGIPVKWTLNASGDSLNGCNNSIVIPAYNLQIKLQTGENIIEFTPDQSGTFAFSCWMGMVRSSITVVSEDGTVADNQDDGSNRLPAGCCGSQ